MASAASRPVLSWAPTLVTPGGNTVGAANTRPSPSKLVFNRERILHLDSRIGASCWCTKHGCGLWFYHRTFCHVNSFWYILLPQRALALGFFLLSGGSLNFFRPSFGCALLFFSISPLL